VKLREVVIIHIRFVRLAIFLMSFRVAIRVVRTTHVFGIHSMIYIIPLSGYTRRTWKFFALQSV